MNFKELESAEKLGGVYYTPAPIANFLAQWIDEIQPKRVLEPSCGEGAFLEALATLGEDRDPVDAVAVDIDPSALKAVQAKCDAGKLACFKTALVEGDFLQYSVTALKNEARFDAVLGNPPFIRYQYLEKQYQEATERIFEEAGLKFTRHTNAWVPFVLQGVRLLRPGGRLGMVIPAEIMHVLHANSLRAFLLKTCEEVAVVHLEDLFSDDVLQGVVLLLCTKRQETTTRGAKIAFPHAGTLDLVNGHAVNFLHSIQFMPADKLDYKWMEGLLTSEEVEVYEKAKSLANVHRFADLASVDVGIVTGANSFFLVPDSTVKEYGLARFAHPMFGRSSHVRGVQVRDSDIEENRKQGLPSNFIYFPAVEKAKLPEKVRAYISLGEKQKLHTRYKCRIRKPWYVVPSVWAAGVAMLKRAHDIPRLILNEARAYTTDTAYRIKMHALYEKKGARLVWNFVNSLTALSAELEGRHYGGGVIELVPSEIERLLVPFVPGGQRELQHLDAMFRAGKSVQHILKEQDAIILKDVGLSEEERAVLQGAWLRLKRRRQRTET